MAQAFLADYWTIVDESEASIKVMETKSLLSYSESFNICANFLLSKSFIFYSTIRNHAIIMCLQSLNKSVFYEHVNTLLC